MGNDKLNLTARAAGFAMACDETVGGPSTKAAQPQVPAAQVPRIEAPVARATAMVPAASSKPGFNFGTIGFAFWKTA